MSSKKVTTKPLSLQFTQVNLHIALSINRSGTVESCCNYDITGETGNLLLVLPPMTHIQDMTTA